MKNNTKPTIMIIDDEPTIRQSFAFLLDDHDYKTIQAANGREGLEIFEHEKVDLILVDLRMPEIDGLKVLSRIKLISPNTPLIVISGTGSIGDAVEALHLGAWDYLLKPIQEYSLLLHAVENALEKAKLIEENQEYQKNLEIMVAKKTEKINKALEEKKILLKELNHRVKNNLNVIISLLSLKSNTITLEKNAIEAFNECSNLVYSMSMVHEELYQSEDLSEINMESYIEKLAIKMIEIYNPIVSIDYKLNIDDININISKAIPCGLILTELITNALKYAFNDSSKKGLLKIYFSKLENDKFQIRVIDNGPGIPDNIDLQNPESTGLQIINILTSQIEGTLSAKNNNGAEFIITFSE